MYVCMVFTDIVCFYFSIRSKLYLIQLAQTGHGQQNLSLVTLLYHTSSYLTMQNNNNNVDENEVQI